MSAEDSPPRIRVGLGDAPLLGERQSVHDTKCKLLHDSSSLVLQSFEPHRMASVREGAGGYRYNRQTLRPEHFEIHFPMNISSYRSWYRQEVRQPAIFLRTGLAGSFRPVWK